MRLEVRTPLAVAIEAEAVRRVAVETPAGSFGLRPRRLDLVLPLAAGILIFEDTDGLHYVAIDDGFLVKAGPLVRVSVRQALTGELTALREAVDARFRAGRVEEHALHEALVALEVSMIRHLGAREP